LVEYCLSGLFYIEHCNTFDADYYDDLILIDDTLKTSDREVFCGKLDNAEFP
jgi:hypothetical protein